MKPVRRMPSRSAMMGSAFSANSRPMTAARRSNRAAAAVLHQVGCRSVAQHDALAIAEAEGDLRMSHGQALDHLLRMAEFAARRI